MRFTSDEHAPWDFEVEVRGLVIPTLSPQGTPEVTVVRNQTEVEAKLTRKPGVLVRLWRWLFGEPMAREAISLDAETEHVRSLCLAFVPPSHHHMVHELNGGDLMLLFAAYQGAQVAWCQRVRDAAARAQAPEPSVPEAHQTQSSVPLVPLVAGGPIPAILQGLEDRSKVD
jgi:hypothetical protein